MEQQRRWRFLEDNRAVTMAGWLPPAQDVPLLADLCDAHERVLGAAAEASREASDLVQRRNAELEAVRAAEEEALFTGKPVEAPDVTVNEEEIAEARRSAEAARDAEQRFVQHAIRRVCELEPEIQSALSETRREAAAKRAEAHVLLAEAEAMERTPQRVDLWLERFNGRSMLGHYPYDAILAPAPPEPLDMEAALAGGTFTEVETYA